MTDVNIKIQAAKNERKLKAEIPAVRGIKEITVSIENNNGSITRLHTDEVTAGNVYYLLNELREELLKELE